MSHPTAADAKNRRVVLLPDGRTGRVVFVPPPPGATSRFGSPGRKARVVLPDGRHRSVARDDLTVIEGAS